MVRVSEILSFTVYVTGCDLAKSFSFDNTVGITSHARFLIYIITCKHIVLNTCDLSSSSALSSSFICLKEPKIIQTSKSNKAKYALTGVLIKNYSIIHANFYA